MAPAGYKTFVAGAIFTAAEVNTYLMQQTVNVFADSTARDAAITSPSEGQCCYDLATNFLQIYDGTAWVNVLSSAGQATKTQTQVVKITATGSFTKATYPWATNFEILCVGGGGAGGGADNDGLSSLDASMGSGGGGGGWAIKYATAGDLASAETVTIGAGGVGLGATDGTDGGDTSFGTLCVAGGGFGGKYTPKDSISQGQGYDGGWGGEGSVGDIFGRGGHGGNSWMSSVETGFGGYGGSSYFAGSTQAKVAPPTGTISSPGLGVGNNFPGTGGGGAYDSNGFSNPDPKGGDGSDGICIVKMI